MPLTQRTVQLVERKQKELTEIKWTDGEANTDSGFSRVACIACVEAWNEIKSEFPSYATLTLEATAPDITISFKKDAIVIAKGKIELKSGKNDSIPGSTIGKLDINEPVIYCLRKTQGAFELHYGQYWMCMGETDKDLFQDRTPRPAVNFKKMHNSTTSLTYVHKEQNDWVKHYAECALNRINTGGRSWQDYLTKEVIRLFINNTSIEEFAKLKSAI